MQIKRLGQNFYQYLPKRAGGMVVLAEQREQPVGYIRHIVALNDEERSFLPFQQVGVEITLIIPLNIFYPYFPNVLTKSTAADPSKRVRLSSMNTCLLEKRFAARVHNITLKTELLQAGTGNLLSAEPLELFRARNQKVWRRVSLPISFDANCIFQEPVLTSLDTEVIP